MDPDPEDDVWAVEVEVVPVVVVSSTSGIGPETSRVLPPEEEGSLDLPPDEAASSPLAVEDMVCDRSRPPPSPLPLVCVDELRLPYHDEEDEMRRSAFSLELDAFRRVNQLPPPFESLSFTEEEERGAGREAIELARLSVLLVSERDIELALGGAGAEGAAGVRFAARDRLSSDGADGADGTRCGGGRAGGGEADSCSRGLRGGAAVGAGTRGGGGGGGLNSRTGEGNAGGVIVGAGEPRSSRIGARAGGEGTGVRESS